jgi:hypothetical protein
MTTRFEALKLAAMPGMGTRTVFINPALVTKVEVEGRTEGEPVSFIFHLGSDETTRVSGVPRFLTPVVE